jgi:tetratricopeptide (TPR) repeat protein
VRSTLLTVLSAIILAPATHAADQLVFNLHMSDCEDRWVVLRHEAGDEAYRYGFAYIDPQAGFTVHIGGSFTIDDQGRYHKAPDPLDGSQASLKIRLAGNGMAALLPKEAIIQLEIPDPPEWLKFYEDSSDPITHKVRWGFQYNQLGDSAKALTYLEPAYKEKPQADGLEFELAYAYNALGKTERAISVLKPAILRNPTNMFLCKELAYADLNGNKLQESINQHVTCIALCNKDQSAEKSEMAMNIAHAYELLGDRENSQKWIANAKEWAPKGSPVYKYFYPDEKE